MGKGGRCRRGTRAGAAIVAALCALALPAKGASALADTADSDEVAQGRALLARYQCGSCHAIPGVDGAQGRAAGSLAQFGRRSYIAGRLPNRPEVLARWIEDPPALVPGTAMPSMGVLPEDARRMALYLGQLR